MAQVNFIIFIKISFIPQELLVAINSGYLINLWIFELIKLKLISFQSVIIIKKEIIPDPLTKKILLS